VSDDNPLNEIIDEAIDISDNYLVYERNGKIEALNLDNTISPHMQKCSGCTIDECKERAEDNPNAVCVHEKDFVIAIIKTLKDENIDIEGIDKLLVFPLIQNYLRMRRMYILETSEKFLKLFNTKDGQNKAREFYKVLKDSENTYIRSLKELIATRKEKRLKTTKREEEQKNLFLRTKK